MSQPTLLISLVVGVGWPSEFLCAVRLRLLNASFCFPVAHHSLPNRRGHVLSHLVSDPLNTISPSPSLFTGEGEVPQPGCTSESPEGPLLFPEVRTFGGR